MPNAHAHRMRLRLFLEGVEVPVIAANIEAAPNSPMVASIQIPPLAEGTRFHPRTIVHLFFLDFRAAANPFINPPGAAQDLTDQKSPTSYEQSQAGDPSIDEYEAQGGGETIANASVGSMNSNYKLLFGGEIVGFQWTKNQAQRSLVLQCFDWSNYWDYAYQWNNTGIFGPGVKAVFSGGATNLFTDFLSSKGSMITSIVSSGFCNSFPRLKGLAAGIIRLLEAIGGSYYVRPLQDNDARRVVKKYAGQNIFFSLAELRLHITHMIAAYENDPTSQRLLSRHGYSGLFDRALGSLGGQVSIRQSINALTKIIFHETYPQPCPLYKPGLEGTVSGSVRIKLKDDPSFGQMSDNAEHLRVFAQNVLDKLVAAEEDPDLALFGVGRKKFVADIKDKLALAKKFANFVLASSRGGPETAIAGFSQSNRLIAQAGAQMTKWAPTGPAGVRTSVKDKLTRVKEQMVRVRDLTVSTTPPKLREPARLNQQILRPDIWFGAPPRCNVIFPEDYDQISYQRMFLQEPTRFMLKTNDEFFGEDFLFDKFYFAPQAGSLKADKAQLSSILKNDLLDHELFTGILPVFEKMGEFNVFAAQSGTQQQPAPKIGFAQRSANFIYFKHRFAARQMRVDGKFNPWIAVGCPGLIIDKYVDRSTLALYNELREKKELPLLEIGAVLGTNFLGNFTQVSHRISQQEPMNRTEITCSYPRQPEESVEFLGAPEKVQRVRKRQDKDAMRATDIAAVSPPKLFSLGPNGGRITAVNDVTSAYQDRSRSELEQLEDAGTSGQRLPVYQRGFNTLRPLIVPIGVQVTSRDVNSPELATYAGDPDRPIVFYAFRLDEEIPRYKTEEVDLPAEEFIRPGWYGDVWTNSKIGRVYEDFFGIGAITDGQTINDQFGASIGIEGSEMEAAQSEAAQAESADDPRIGAPSQLELEQGASIQQAVEFLLLTYSYIKQEGMDVEEFIRAYTWRPVATMTDMFGTSDLEFNETGETVVQGIEGFHSRAFGPYENVFGLVGPDLEDIVGIKRGSTVSSRGDTRLRKLEQVQLYVSALRFSRALLG